MDSQQFALSPSDLRFNDSSPRVEPTLSLPFFDVHASPQA